MNRYGIVQDVLAMNYLMRQATTRDEAERVVHALVLANYDIVPRPPERAVRSRSRIKCEPET